MKNMFTNYSVTFAASIVSVAGLLASVLAVFGYSIPSGELQFIIGNVVNVVGIIVVLYRRWKQGDVNILGARK